MNSNDLMTIYALAAILWMVIIYNIIASATKAGKIEKNLRIQTDLLSEIAKINGVPAERIAEITK